MRADGSLSVATAATAAACVFLLLGCTKRNSSRYEPLVMRDAATFLRAPVGAEFGQPLWTTEHGVLAVEEIVGRRQMSHLVAVRDERSVIPLPTKRFRG